MTRVLFYIVQIALVVAAAVWLADHPGRVSIVAGGYRIDTSVGVLAVAVFALILAGAALYQALRMLRRAPSEIASSRRSRRRARGYKALTQGMVAVAAGDAAEAGRHARRANALLNDPPLTMLLSAQTAQIEGDEEAARKYFQAMLGRPEMEFLGLRGLLMQAIRAGDSGRALGYARRAYELRPQTPWVLTTLFDLQVRAGAWDEADKTLDEAIRRRAIEPDRGRRDKVIVLFERSRAAQAAGQRARALSLARKAVDLAHGFVPGAAHLARLSLGEDNPRRAARVVEEAWREAPHPELLALYREAQAPADPMAWLKEVQKLAEHNPAHPETRLALAGAALEARLWGEARRNLEAVLDTNPSARACRLRAELEEAEHGDAAAVRDWLARAAEAAPDPAWVCEHCGAVFGDWSPLCRRCDAFDGLVWRSPERAVILIGPAAPAASAAVPALESQVESRPAGPAPRAAGKGR